MIVVGEGVPNELDLAPLIAFVAKGGRAVVLRQDRAPAGLPVPLSLVNKDSSICYRRAYGHPLLEGLSDPDLKYWRGDHLVTRKEYAKPVRGSFRCLLDSGTLKGLDCTPLIEIYQGKGSYVLSQLRLVGKWRTEPIAAGILKRLVSRSVVMPAPSVPELGLMASRDSRLPNLLAKLRVRCRRAADLSGMKGLLTEADAIDDRDVGRLLAFVQAGRRPLDPARHAEDPGSLRADRGNGAGSEAASSRVHRSLLPHHRASAAIGPVQRGGILEGAALLPRPRPRRLP